MFTFDLCICATIWSTVERVLVYYTLQRQEWSWTKHETAYLTLKSMFLQKRTSKVNLHSISHTSKCITWFLVFCLLNSRKTHTSKNRFHNKNIDSTQFFFSLEFRQFLETVAFKRASFFHSFVLWTKHCLNGSTFRLLNILHSYRMNEEFVTHVHNMRMIRMFCVCIYSNMLGHWCYGKSFSIFWRIRFKCEWKTKFNFKLY